MQSPEAFQDAKSNSSSQTTPEQASNSASLPANEETSVVRPPENRSLAGGSSDSYSLDGAPRGEVFNWVENAPVKNAPPIWGWPLFITLGALAYCLYLLGALVGSNSRQPLPVGPLTAAAPPKIRVQIAGQVRKPGVYELSSQARVQDLLKKAGGPLPKADLNALNLAAWPQDGSKITVPMRSSARPTPIVIVREVPVQVPVEVPIESLPEAPAITEESAPVSEPAREDEKPKTRVASGTKPKSSAASKNASIELLRKNPLDLNRAPIAQLEQLPGIGPKIAERILAYRAENGGFKSVAELDQVKGIGEVKLAKLKGLIYVR